MPDELDKRTPGLSLRREGELGSELEPVDGGWFGTGRSNTSHSDPGSTREPHAGPEHELLERVLNGLHNLPHSPESSPTTETPPPSPQE
ncbi:hypothetical protein [Haloactinomyces albus]|uniref:Uncharacterized protein n=1 Tax=Haloactinomyces albus TaxID=1352928 RepID=A0AAE3ZHI4_9ACTN|nr:hypothetical protein [Haloactinomyces albus]MDR7303322.1 hypothetical protein [Haloactinomyces albus]